MPHRIPRFMTARVLGNAAHGVFHRIEASTPSLAPFIPGQFAMVSAPHGDDPLLPRPLAIVRSEGDQGEGIVEFVYKVVGRGTQLLSRLRRDDLLSITLPLGNGFNLDGAGKIWWLVGGGVGVSTMIPAAAALAKEKADFRFFLGARSGDQHPPREWIPGWDIPEIVCSCTDDGGFGFCGTVGAAVREQYNLLLPSDRERLTILACGPRGMLKDIAETALSLGIPAQASLENYMACGFGVCFGCVMEIKTGEGAEYLRVCREGPVFDVGAVVW